MNYFEMDNRNLLTYKSLEKFPEILAFTTMRQMLQGDSLPRFTGEPKEKVWENRKLLAKELGINPGQLVFPRQMHTSCVAELTQIPDKEFAETDALITHQPGICLCVQTADCVPVLMFDPEKNVIAAVHAGWRGTVKKIAEVTVLKMKTNYNCEAENIKAVIGPSIGPGVYEVGDEVVKGVKNNVPHPEKLLHKNSSGEFHLNLWEANQQILLSCGLLSKNIETARECTFSGKEKYFSARRDGAETSRIVSGIMLK